MPLVTFLNAIGIKWPYIDEDALHSFAQLAREFGQAVEQTHQDATDAVNNIAQAYQGASTQAMTSGWGQLSETHVKEVTAATSILADAIDAWAVYVVVQKGQAIAQMVELAIGYATALAAAPETFGASLAALPGLEELGEALGNSLINDLEQYVIGKVIEAASKPLADKIEAMMQGLDWSNSQGGGDQSGSGGSGDSGSAGSGGIQLDMGAVQQHVSTLRQHAETMRSHAADFHAKAAGINF